MPSINLVYVVLGVIGAFIITRENLAKWVVRVLLPERSEARVVELLATGSDQKDTIDALRTRLEVLEKDLGTLKEERARDTETITRLEQARAADAATIKQLTRERETLQRRVRALTARVKNLEQSTPVDAPQGDPHD